MVRNFLAAISYSLAAASGACLFGGLVVISKKYGGRNK